MNLKEECPQCAAPVTLEETDRLFLCPHCQVRLLVRSEDCPCHYLAPLERYAGGGCYYAPYWRFRGMALRIDGAGASHRVIDITERGGGPESIPPTLGLRAQAGTLRYATLRTGGRFWPLASDAGAFINRLEQRLERSRKGGEGAPGTGALVGEVISVIYAPFAVEQGSLLDGVSGRALTNGSSAYFPEMEPGSDLPPHPAWPVSFHPALCPDCGWDLKGERNSLVFFCTHCDSVWQDAMDKLERIDIHFPAREQHACRAGTDLLLPFWRLEVHCPGLPLSSMADLVRLTNIPRAILPTTEATALRFWVPAFKISPNLLLRLSAHMTLRQIATQRLEGLLPKGVLYPITLPPEEGSQTIPVLLAAMAPAKGVILGKLRGLHFVLKSADLVLTPAQQQGRDWVQPGSGFGLPVNALHWAGFI
jgi:predicted RNA-binding Zn-ribbon protein involved in translation (DUF1610 family)